MCFKAKCSFSKLLFEKTLKQTVECAIFIREYTGHGFGGRLARQTVSNTGQKINDFLKALVGLKQSLDSINISFKASLFPLELSKASRE